jgi:CheY-like chemotaxis protein
VLVVEDDSPIREMLADLLQEAGYKVAEAVNGFQAIERLQAQRPDLIVLDLMLPGMSGWEFLERSRQQLQASGIPVLVLSAISGRGDYPATLGVAAWFTKPLDVPRFLTAVEQLAGPSPVASSKRNGAPHHRGRPRVLIVEDEGVIRDLLTERLDEEGYLVDVAASVEEACDRLTDQPSDVILLDLMLPGDSGWSFLRRRRGDPVLAAIPVLVVSAAPRDRLLEAKELGADGFLSKPFDMDVLSALLRSYAV